MTFEIGRVLGVECYLGDFKRLDVWRASHALALSVYRASLRLPSSERYGLIAQLQRSAASIPANLAEGCGRRSDAELRRFVRIGLGSATELEYHLILAGDLGLLDPATTGELTAAALRVQGMLATLMRSLRLVDSNRGSHGP